MRWVFLFILILSAFSSRAQSGAAKRALKALEDNDLEKAEKQILRGLEKDSLDPMLLYDIASFQLAQEPVNIDSASVMERVARELWDLLPADEYDKYQKAGISEARITQLRQRIDSLAFNRAYANGGEEAYVSFLDYFPDAAQTDQAIRLRDSVAFSTAASENTYPAYRNFMDKYPDALQYSEAEGRYDLLLFEASTKPGTLQALENFLQEHPKTPYRSRVEEDIFSMRTANPTAAAYRSVIRDFPNSAAGRTARNYLFHQHKWENSPEVPDRRTWGDSIVQMFEINRENWVATYDKENAIFLDQQGEDKFTIEKDELSDRYECASLEHGLIVARNGLLSRTGNSIYGEPVDEVEFLPAGLVRIVRRGKEGIITVWGREVLPVDFLEVRMAGESAVYARKGGKFAVYSLAGLQLTDAIFDDIAINGSLLHLYRNDQVALVSLADLQLAVATRKKPVLNFVDDFEVLPGGEIWMALDDKEWITDENLQPKIPADIQRIDILANGYVCSNPVKVVVYSLDKLQKFTTEEKLLASNDRYLRFTSADGEGLFDLVTFRFVALPDSAALPGRNSAITYQKDGVKTYLDSPEPVEFPGNYTGYSILRTGATELIVHKTARGEFIVVDNNPVKLPENRELSLLNDSLLIIQQASGRGLWNIKDQAFVLQPRYDGLANFDGRDLSVFRNKKFGVYRVPDNLLIPVSYDKLVDAFGDSLFVVVQGDKRGVVNAANEVVIPAEYEEIMYWTDSLALVKEAGSWYFYVIPGKVRSGDAMTTLRFTGRNDSYMMCMIDGKFGVFKKYAGEIIPATFDDIVNIGTAEHPVFFTETHVEAADLHVVIYFDRDGNLLRRQAMDPDLFYEVYCEE